MSQSNNKSGLQQATDAAAAAKKLMEAVKAVTEGLATGNWTSLVKLLLPIIIFIVLAIFLFTVMFATSLFAPIADGKTAFDNPDKFISNDFKQEVINAVTDAYSRANQKVIDKINSDYLSAAASYNQTYLNIINPLENSSILEPEIYKTYAMFTVYKDRMFAIEHMKNPDMKMEDESKLYNIDDLKDMMSGKYNLLLHYTVSKNAWTYQPTKWDAAKKAYVNDGSPVSHCTFTYTISTADIDTVGPSIFDLADRTNDTSLPEEARIDEIAMAIAKTQSIAAIFSDSLDEYGGDAEMDGSGTTGQSTYTSKADYSSFITDNTVTNINFTPDTKMSVPLGGSYHLSSHFGPRIHPIKKVLKFHTGVDLGAASGTDIYSLANGVAVKTGFNDGYGNFLIVYHGEIGGSYYFTTYNHMKEPAPVSVGQVVTNSTIVGKVGSTGLSTGPHLHFEIRVGTKTGDNFSFVFKNPSEFLIQAQ